MNLIGLFSTLQDEINDDRLKLPALPDVALRVQKAIQDPHTDLTALARLIQLDAGLCAYLLQIANCALYRGARPVDNLNTAISRIGFTATKNYVMSYAMMAIFASDSPVIKSLLKQQWQFSTRLAAITAVLARRLEIKEHDTAMLAGLMQDIGALPILGKAAQYPPLLKEPEQLTALMDQYAGIVGAKILQKWQFDPRLVECARVRNLWRRDHEGNWDFADLVTVARVHAVLGTPCARQLPPFSEIPAFKKLTIESASAQWSLDLLAEAKTEIAEIQRELRG